MLNTLSRLSLCVCLTLGISCSAIAASVMEEVVVTAQRQEENLQEVPIAVTALTGEMLEDKGVVNPSDLQMSAPNLSFTATNFGGSSISIRGIGRLVISSNADSGVSTHVDEIPLNTNMNAIEFFDVQRIEVLRGPQGTLFGRNATGGSINLVTRKPEYDALNGFVDVEAGDYGHLRVKGAINIPLGAAMGLRLAGFNLERDGYIENLAADSASTIDGSKLPYINDDVDGRDIQAYRATWAWDFSDNGNVWVQYNKFDEDDDRARVTNQVCKRTELPTLGCEPNAFGNDAPHLGSTTGGLFFMTNPFRTLPLGARGDHGADGITYDHRAPPLGLREMFTDFEPVFEYEEEFWSLGATYDFGNYTVSFLGAYQETDYLAQMDYNMDVGPVLAPNPIPGFDGRWPTSAPAGRAGADVSGGPCNYYDGTAGVFGGCVVPADGTRSFAMDQSDDDSEYWTAELRLASRLDGPFNFQVGISTYERKLVNDYYVNANSLDSVGLAGTSLLFGLPLYPTMFNVPRDPDEPEVFDGKALFAEAYFDIDERTKLTFGLRYNKDEKYVYNASGFLSSLDQASLLRFLYLPNFGGDPKTAIAAGFLDPDYQAALDSLPAGKWGRGTCIMLPSAPGCNPRGFTQGDLDRLAFHEVPQSQVEAAAATRPFSPERAALLNAIGAIPGFNEVRVLNGNPDTEEWTAVTGRIGIDHQWRDEVMLYAFFSRGYKPGGFNPPIAPEFQDDTAFAFEEEEVDSFEVGFKSTLLDGQLVLNGSAFLYDYADLQVTRIRNNSSINENIDADIMGLELEWVWQPEEMANLAVDGAFSWLDTELQDVMSVDVLDKGAGDSNWINLKNIDPGAITGTNYVAWAPDITPAVIEAAYTAPTPGALSHVNGRAVPGTVYANGIPAYFARSFLDAQGVRTSSGEPSDLDGNRLPNSPEFTFRLGVQYTWPIAALVGDLTLRWDYYWQDDSYGREFNTVGDEIDSWDQHNLSFIYESSNGDWQARLWARNLQNEDNVTGHYLTSDTSGYYRNYFLTEPRVYGLSVRYQFGGD